MLSSYDEERPTVVAKGPRDAFMFTNVFPAGVTRYAGDCVIEFPPGDVFHPTFGDFYGTIGRQC